MIGDAAQVGILGIVGAALDGAEHRVETLGVEIAIIDLMSAAPQCLDDRAMQSRREAVAEWRRKDDENAHRQPRGALFEAVAQDRREAETRFRELRPDRGERLRLVILADLVERR